VDFGVDKEDERKSIKKWVEIKNKRKIKEIINEEKIKSEKEIVMENEE
jgi:serine protease inhibitor